MSNEKDGISLSITLPDDCAGALDNLVSAGAYGSSREEVVRHKVCRALGVDPRPKLPDAPSAETTAEVVSEDAPPAEVVADGGPGDIEKSADVAVEGAQEEGAQSEK